MQLLFCMMVGTILGAYCNDEIKMQQAPHAQGQEDGNEKTSPLSLGIRALFYSICNKKTTDEVYVSPAGEILKGQPTLILDSHNNITLGCWKLAGTGQIMHIPNLDLLQEHYARKVASSNQQAICLPKGVEYQEVEFSPFKTLGTLSTLVILAAAISTTQPSKQ